MSATRLLPLLLLALSPLMAACRGEHVSRSARPSAESGRHWNVLGTWSGTGDRQTESFDITSGSLRLVWWSSGAQGPDAGHLRVALHSSISGRPLETVVDVRGAGADTVLVAAEPRVAYLLVESDHVEWRLTLEEGVQSEGGAEPSSD